MTAPRPAPAVDAATDPRAGLPGPVGSAAGRTPRRLVLTVVGLGVLLLAAIRVVTGADDLTSSGSFSAAIGLAVPIGLAGLGGLYAERAGIVNIGLEGMMILGTWFGAYAGWRYGVWWGVVAGVIGGAGGGLVHGVATIRFGVDHIVSGVAVNILAAGLARYLSVVAFTDKTGGGASLSPPVSGDIGALDVPFLAGGFGTPDALGWLSRQRWFLVSDVAGLLRALTGSLSWLTVLAVALVPLTYWLLWRTAFGLRLRSAGEHPTAADTLGVNVYAMKYAGVMVSGALAGLGGAFLVVEAGRIYREGQTAGRGFIGLATLIFGNWRPGGVALGAGLFGYADALQLRAAESVHAMLLFVAVALALVAVLAASRRRLRVAGTLAVLAAGFLAWFAVSDTVPNQIVFFTPHLATLLVLAFAAQRLRPPAADGQPWRKGQT